MSLFMLPCFIFFFAIVCRLIPFTTGLLLGMDRMHWVPLQSRCLIVSSIYVVMVAVPFQPVFVDAPVCRKTAPYVHLRASTTVASIPWSELLARPALV